MKRIISAAKIAIRQGRSTPGVSTLRGVRSRGNATNSVVTPIIWTASPQSTVATWQPKSTNQQFYYSSSFCRNPCQALVKSNVSALSEECGQRMFAMVQTRGKKSGKKKREERAAKKAEKEATMASGEGEAAPPTTSNHDHEDDHDEHDEEDEAEEEGDSLPDLDKVKEKVFKIVGLFEASLKKIRGAEPTAEIFDDVMVEAYGEHTSLKTVAQVVISTPKLAIATCFDPSMAKIVGMAIQNQLAMNPSVEEDGSGTIKIPLPKISMEVRENTAKILGKKTEMYRQKIRKIRRKYMDRVKLGVAGKLEHVAKDDAFMLQKELDKVVDNATKQLDDLYKQKHDSIMAV